MLEVQYKGGEEVPNGINLLISILVRYPEIGTINYDPQSQCLKFSFLINQNAGDQNHQEFIDRCKMSLDLLHQLEGQTVRSVEINQTYCGEITIFEVVRDIETLSAGEISLIINLMQDEFRNSLVLDQGQEFYEEELVQQEELISRLLRNTVSATPHGKNLIGFREEGKVLVFNKG